MKIYQIFCLFCVLFFSSCASKSEFDDRLSAESLFYTQKIRFVGEETNALLLLTYLNPVLEYKSEEELFLLSIVPSEFSLSDFVVQINLQKPLASELGKDEELLRYTIKNEFAKNYKLSIALSGARQFLVEICFNERCEKLSFEKYSKSLYYRSIDVDTQYN